MMDISSLMILSMGQQYKIRRMCRCVVDIHLVVGIKKQNVSMFGILKLIRYPKHNIVKKDMDFIKKQSFMQNG